MEEEGVAMIDRSGGEQVMHADCVDELHLLALGCHDPAVPGVEGRRLAGDGMAGPALGPTRRTAECTRACWAPACSGQGGPETGYVFMVDFDPAADLAVAEAGIRRIGEQLKEPNL